MRILASIVLMLVILTGIVVGCAAPGQTTTTGSASASEAVPGIGKTTTQFDDDNPFSAPAALAVIALIASVISFGYAAWKKWGSEYKEEVKHSKTYFRLGALLILAFLALSSLKVIPVTYVGVIRQAFPVPSYRVVGPGTHFAWPVVSNVRLYTTRIRQMKVFDIHADTKSSGRPQIFPDVVVWFRLPLEDDNASWNKQIVREDILRQLDWSYGPEYESDFLLEKLIASVKEVSGMNDYDYFGSLRGEAQDNIESILEKSLKVLSTSRTSR